jgi:hypothetical protein
LYAYKHNKINKINKINKYILACSFDAYCLKQLLKDVDGTSSMVYFEFDFLEESLSGIFSVSDKVAGGGANSERVSSNVNIFLNISGVNSSSAIIGSGSLGSSGGGLVGGPNESGEGGHNSGCGGSGGQSNIHDHIIEKQLYQSPMAICFHIH